MAFIDDEDKLKKEQDPNELQNQGQAGGVVSAGQPAELGGEQSAIVGGGSSAGVSGAGGLGGWTNIQSYISANKNDTGSAQMLQDKVGGQFEKEKTQLADSASKVQSEAQKAASVASDAKAKAGDWLSQAGQAYDWNGGQSDAYKTAYSNLENGLNATYNGPREFNYGFGNDTQEYASQLGDRDAFDQFMGNLYQDRVKAPLSSGGRALQRQLDVNNENLVSTRQKLLEDYSGLGALRDKTVADTTSALSNAEKQFRTDQNAFRDYLGNTASQLDTSIAKQEADARAAYENTFKSGQSGQAGFGRWPRAWAGENGGRSNIIADEQFDAAESQFRNEGLLGDNLTWAQLAREQELGDPFSGHFDSFRNWKGDGFSGRVDQSFINANRDRLNQFYSEQDAKYGNTADTEERQWNVLSDLLKLGNKKQQGFKVRG